jgi:hypothetical protein
MTHGTWTTTTSPTHNEKGPGLFKPNATGPGHPTSRLSEYGDLASETPTFFTEVVRSTPALTFSPRKGKVVIVT